MYRPTAFREDHLDVMQALIRAHPLAMLVTSGARGLMANPIPFLIDPDAGDKGTLRAHLARANEQVAELRAGTAALVLFQGPDSYVTPSWYPSKTEHGMVVPTWNYIAVHVWGTPRVIDDAQWLRGQITDLTQSRERDRDRPWAVGDAPEAFVVAQIKAIVGLEIPIDRIEGKWKVSQNRSEADRHGVVEGLQGGGEDAEAIARLVTERGGK